MTRLSPQEELIEGGFLDREVPTEPNEATNRIRVLVAEHLVKVATTDGGWTTLFVDPVDGRYWELTYPDSESHGGGAPRLEHIPKETVMQRYGKQIDRGPA